MPIRNVFKLSIGVLLLVFPAALYFQRKPMAFTFGGRVADAAIGFAGGILGGLAGLSGALPTLWASVRGWGKDERRGVFQTFNWTVLFAALCLQAGMGLVSLDVVWLALIAFPATITGAWLGARAYRALSDRNFRDLVLALLFLSGVGTGLEQHRRCGSLAWPPCEARRRCTRAVKLANPRAMPFPRHCPANISVCCWVSSAWRSSAARCRRRASRFPPSIRWP